MIRLRFVEEYRGRRIVTNGRLYGIQGELVTDCRYLNAEGARAAINSETGIAAHQKDLASQRRNVAEFLAHTGEQYGFVCDCGWRGTYAELKKEGSVDVVVRCPMCGSDYIYIALDTDAPARFPGTAPTAQWPMPRALAAPPTRRVPRAGRGR